MPGTALSSHVPDPDLISYLAERNTSWFSRASPWTKAGVLVWLVVAVTVIPSLLVTGLLLSVVIALYASCGLPVRRLAGWCVMPVVFVVSLVILMIWSVPGAVLFSLPFPGGPVSLTTGGLSLLFLLVGKALVTVIYSLTFIMTTPMAELSAFVSRALPSPADQIFLLAYRFLFVTLATLAAMLTAIRARGGLVSGVVSQTRLMAEVFGLLFIRSFERSERVMKAMQSRGYRHDLIAATPVTWPGPGGIAVLAIACCALGAAVASGAAGGAGI